MDTPSLLKILDLIPLWKNLKTIPNEIKTFELRIAEIENAVAELEKRLERCPLEGCPKCGELALKETDCLPSRDKMQRFYKCDSCGHETQKFRD